MATLNELVIALGFDVESQAFQKLSQFVGAAKGISEVFDKIGKTVTGGLGFKEFLSGTASKAQDLVNLSNTIGMSTESIQQWQYAAEKAGVSAQTVIGDITQLTTKWRKSQNGVLALAKQIQNASPFMVQAYKNMYGLSDDIVTLMRRGPQEIKKYMKEIKENGGIISDEDLRKGQEFKESLYRVKTTIVNTAQAVATQFMPQMQEMADGFNEWIKDADNQKTAILGLKTALYGLAGASFVSALATLATNVTLVATAVKALTAASWAFAASPIGLIALAIAGLGGWIWNFIEGKSLDSSLQDPLGEQKRLQEADLVEKLFQEPVGQKEREQAADLVDKIFDDTPKKIKIEGLPSKDEIIMAQRPQNNPQAQPSTVNITITTSETWGALKESLRENAGIDISRILDGATKSYNQNA